MTLYSSFIPLKCHYFSTQALRTLPNYPISAWV